MAKLRRTEARDSKILPLRVLNPQLEDLEKMTNLYGINRAEIVRALIPGGPLLDLAVAFPDHPIWDILKFRLCDSLCREMTGHSEYPLRVQVESAGENLEAVVKLYIHWRNALAGKPGFTFNKVIVEDDEGNQDVSWMVKTEGL